MSRRKINKVVILGSGPIVIGQACEFDYSGTQACKALMKDGLEVVLINSNPATIMTDPEIAHKVYIEPLKLPFVKKVLEKERPDAIIPTLGGQTALNLGLELSEAGVLKELGIEMLGADPDVIRRAEDRELFREILDDIGAHYPKSYMVKTFEHGLDVGNELGFPIILRPNYTLGGGGGGIAYSLEEYKSKLALALHESPTTEVLVEESILGWKEFELEIMRDRDGTFVVICSIENIDPCGVHTGDSVTVAPQQTLTDQEYQLMRDEAKKIVEKVGVQTGGANIQFAVDPQSGKRVVIEMNPRVSRSSALASKATGFPIAKIAALLAVGYTLDEIQNDITKLTPSCYEPALDYVVTKIPRFAFEKFNGAKDSLSTQMKSVGEVMGIGRTFQESFLKAFLSMENSDEGFPDIPFSEKLVSYPNSQRFYHIFQALREGHSVEKIHEWTQMSHWFLEQFEDIVKIEQEASQARSLTHDFLKRAKRKGLSDARIGKLFSRSESEVRKERVALGIVPRYLKVDTCAGEFASETPYFYSTYWSKPASRTPDTNSVVLIGSGPNRIGQGVEFDYSCVRSVRQFQKLGHKVIMVNSNPETVSTDYDTSDELYFEPITREHLLSILDHIQPMGFVPQLGGQTPINLSKDLVDSGHTILGSSVATLDLAEDRAQFVKICADFDFKVPESGMASSYEAAVEVSSRVGFPMVCRPSYVLGGRRMEVLEGEEDLKLYFQRHGSFISEANPCLMDQFLERALEVDVDLVRCTGWSVVGGIIEHIEAAGVHSGDSMGVVPPQRLRPDTQEKIATLSIALADRMDVQGFMNLQLAVKNDEVYMIEVNPRSSRSVPFISKATGVPLVDLGVKAILNLSSDQVHPEKFNWQTIDSVCVKGVVFPFKKFAEADSILGPEMKSTGESMGRGHDYSEALLKAMISSQMNLPKKGEVLFSLRDKDKEEILPVAKELREMGFSISATGGTARYLLQNGVDCVAVKKVHEGRPHCVDRIRSGDVCLVINTTSGRRSIEASFGIRRSCVDYSVPCITESDASKAFVVALKGHIKGDVSVKPIQSMMS